MILKNEELHTIISNITTKTGVGEWIHNIANMTNPPDSLKQTVEACKQVIQFAENYNAYHDLITSLVQTPMEELERHAFISSLNTPGIARMDPKEFMDNFDYNFKRIIQKSEEHINTVYVQKRKLRIESFGEQEKYQTWFQSEYGKSFEAHDALDDIRMQRLIMIEELGSKFDNPDVNYIIMDYETTGLNAASGSILQVAAVDYRTGETIFNLKRKFNPEELAQNIPQRNSPVFNKSLTFEEQVQDFITRFTQADGFTEEEMLSQVLGFLNEQGLNTKLVWYNGEDFDIPFQKQRASLYESLRGAEKVL